jgi:hypothetical protein
VTLAGLGYAAALVLAALLFIAAVAKAIAPDETRRSFQQLGVPNPESAARLVPLPEFAAAILLIVAPAVGGIATLMLLAFFSTFIVTRLRAGVVAPCACFGAASAQPLSWLAIARNVAMAVLAIAALATVHPVRPTLADVAVVVVYVVVVGVALRIGQRSLAA